MLKPNFFVFLGPCVGIVPPRGIAVRGLSVKDRSGLFVGSIGKTWDILQKSGAVRLRMALKTVIMDFKPCNACN